MLWGKKKPTIFDEDQNRQLQALAKNQAILIKNNNSFLETHKNLWSWINQLKLENDKLRARIATLESTQAAMQQVDAEFKQKLGALASLGQTSTEAATEGS